MWHTHREMRSPGEVLEGDHIEVEGDKSCGGQEVRTLEKEHRCCENLEQEKVSHTSEHSN